MSWKTYFAGLVIWVYVKEKKNLLNHLIWILCIISPDRVILSANFPISLIHGFQYALYDQLLLELSSREALWKRATWHTECCKASKAAAYFQCTILSKTERQYSLSAMGFLNHWTPTSFCSSLAMDYLLDEQDDSHCSKSMIKMAE